MIKKIATPKNTRSILKKYEFCFKKSLGQNFLLDENILNKMISCSDIDKNSGVIEVGPGIGALTELLAKNAKKVLGIEIDQRLIPILQETLQNFNNVKIINEDILNIDINELINKELKSVDKIIVVANLPYYITTPIIMNFLQKNLKISSFTIMIQKEVASRLTALPGSKDYGSLSIAIQYYSTVSQIMNIPKTVFIPQPNVDSTVIYIKRRKVPAVNVFDEQFFFKLVKASFAQRRKTILNNLLNNLICDKNTVNFCLTKCFIDPNRRGETLTIDEFSQLANEFYPFFLNNSQDFVV